MMNRALLIHFLGFYALNSLMPSWAVSVDADVLSVWYASFAVIDLIALMSIGPGKGMLRQTAMLALGTSMAWSAALSVEMMLFRDTLQAADGDMQRYFDIVLGLTMIAGAVSNKIAAKDSTSPKERFIP